VYVTEREHGREGLRVRKSWSEGRWRGRQAGESPSFVLMAICQRTFFLKKSREMQVSQVTCILSQVTCTGILSQVTCILSPVTVTCISTLSSYPHVTMVMSLSSLMSLSSCPP